MKVRVILQHPTELLTVIRGCITGEAPEGPVEMGQNYYNLHRRFRKAGLAPGNVEDFTLGGQNDTILPSNEYILGETRFGMKYHKRKYVFLLIGLFSVSRGALPAIGLEETSLLNGTALFSDKPALTITSLTPAQAFNSGMIQYTILGEGFPDTVEVKLKQNELEIPALFPEVSAGNRIQCFFDLNRKPFGDYDLVLTAAGGGESIFKGAFQIRIFILVYEINSQIQPIFFDYNQFKIREDQLFVLRGNIGLLLANPYYYILLEGYTDPQGSRGYNLGLSVKRVESVRRMLVETGIPESRIFTCHYLQESVSLTGSMAKNWDTTRRVDIRLSETPPYKGD